MAPSRLALAGSRSIAAGFAAGTAGALAVVSILGRAPAAPAPGHDVPAGGPAVEQAALVSEPPLPDARRAAAAFPPADVPEMPEPGPLPRRRGDELARAAAAPFPRPPDPPGAPARTSPVSGATPAVADPRLVRSEGAAVDPQLAAARADAQLRGQQDLEAQVEAIRGLVAQQEARRAAEASAAQEREARMEEAVDALLAAQRRLEAGDAHVLELLDGASTALPFTARHALQHARSALAGEDLYLARRWLAVAVSETQRPR